MRYRRLSYRDAMVRTGPAGALGETWGSERVRLLLQSRWRPDAERAGRVLDLTP